MPEINNRSIGLALIVIGAALVMGSIGAEVKLASVGVSVPGGSVEIGGIKPVSSIIFGAGALFILIGAYLLKPSS